MLRSIFIIFYLLYFKVILSSDYEQVDNPLFPDDSCFQNIEMDRQQDDYINPSNNIDIHLPVNNENTNMAKDNINRNANENTNGNSNGMDPQCLTQIFSSLRENFQKIQQDLSGLEQYVMQGASSNTNSASSATAVEGTGNGGTENGGAGYGGAGNGGAGNGGDECATDTADTSEQTGIPLDISVQSGNSNPENCNDNNNNNGNNNAPNTDISSTSSGSSNTGSSSNDNTGSSSNGSSSNGSSSNGSTGNTNNNCNDVPAQSSGPCPTDNTQSRNDVSAQSSGPCPTDNTQNRNDVSGQSSGPCPTDNTQDQPNSKSITWEKQVDVCKEILKNTNNNLMEKLIQLFPERRRTLKIRNRKRYHQELSNRKRNDNEPKWTDWSSWSPCSVSCGPGKQIRYRKCIGENCQADIEMDERQCFQPICTPDLYKIFTL